MIITKRYSGNPKPHRFLAVGMGIRHQDETFWKLGQGVLHHLQRDSILDVHTMNSNFLNFVNVSFFVVKEDHGSVGQPGFLLESVCTNS